MPIVAVLCFVRILPVMLASRKGPLRKSADGKITYFSCVAGCPRRPPIGIRTGASTQQPWVAPEFHASI
jgi:hypothetical protein